MQGDAGVFKAFVRSLWGWGRVGVRVRGEEKEEEKGAKDEKSIISMLRKHPAFQPLPEDKRRQRKTLELVLVCVMVQIKREPARPSPKPSSFPKKRAHPPHAKKTYLEGSQLMHVHGLGEFALDVEHVGIVREHFFHRPRHRLLGAELPRVVIVLVHVRGMVPATGNRVHGELCCVVCVGVEKG